MIMKQLRRYFVAGLIVWIPLGITIFIGGIIVRQMDKSQRFVPEKYLPETWLGFAIPGLGIILTLLVVLITGLLVANFVGRSMVGFWESLLERIPIVRTVYSAAKKFAEVVFSESNQSCKKVLLIQYPREGLYSLAFQTATELGEVQGRTGEDVVCVFLPTTPNPTSGYIIIVPKRDVIELDMEIDEAFKMIVSLGVVVPSWKKNRIGELPLKLPADE